MPQYSILEHHDIETICQHYGIHTVSAFSILSGGSENTNYFVEADQKRYVLTICEQKTGQSARDLAYLLEHLEANGFHTSQVLRTTNNAAISEWNGKPVMVKVFLDGEIIEDLSDPLLQIIGVQIGKLHKIKAPPYLPKVLDYGIEFFNRIHNYAPGSQFADWLEAISHYVMPHLVQDLPKTLIHSDIFYSNIVVRNGDSACIMDFEEAALYYRIFDLGMTLVGLCCSNGLLIPNKGRALLQGYQREQPLNDSEKNALQAFTVYAAASMAFWRHRNFNLVNPTPAMFDHYLGLSIIADSVKDIPATDFQELLK